ncbi:MOSC domain-containing protein [Bacillus capparidis]|uniref:MOSC domain-containing protein YiiM n=1 Tax=Bacillus capparidis TaxID=1840411 RepID=A0ABS4CZR4_9BACI|nr:MOSC domain-containing protein [Bacillus capparidis]MBP1082877.1 MOSC domain-containing protein YiiM [Bacillus capparidis]MED1098136.1 MOSC domain-containing protein [Bacillus capparidis]
MENESFRIHSIHVGKPKTYEFNGKQIETSIYKHRVDQPVFLSEVNFEGDRQADLVYHGGQDKAVCVYPYDHYPYWESQLNKTLEGSAFGENLTVEGLTEKDVYIGDVFALGEAVVQISQPRQPCFKLAKKYDVKDMPLKVQMSGFTGFYFRVLNEGKVTPASVLKRISRDPSQISVHFANHIKYHDKENREGIEKVLKVDALSESWRASFEKMAASL